MNSLDETFEWFVDGVPNERRSENDEQKLLLVGVNYVFSESFAERVSVREFKFFQPKAEVKNLKNFKK